MSKEKFVLIFNDVLHYLGKKNKNNNSGFRKKKKKIGE
jgi:hypothetical protein